MAITPLLRRRWMDVHLQQLQDQREDTVDSTCTCFCSKRGRASVSSVIQKDRGAIWDVIKERRREAASTKRFSPYKRWNSRYFPVGKRQHQVTCDPKQETLEQGNSSKAASKLISQQDQKDSKSSIKGGSKEPNLGECKCQNE